MESILYPDWNLYAGFYLFIRTYNPTRQYLDNTTSMAISIFLAIGLQHSFLSKWEAFLWVINVFVFALVVSVPYWLSGMVGGIIQQMLLLNEQSVQDKRFTDETESISQLSSFLFLGLALKEGALFRPLLSLIVGQEGEHLMAYEQLIHYVTDSMRVIVILSGKYIITMLCVAFGVGLIDVFFKKASLSMNISTDIKIMVVIVIVGMWLIPDQIYLFERMIG